MLKKKINEKIRRKKNFVFYSQFQEDQRRHNQSTVLEFECGRRFISHK